MRIDFGSLIARINQSINQSLRESEEVLKEAIEKEFKGKKSGVKNRRNPYAGKRSALGESLAYDTGKAVKNIKSSRRGKTSVVGVAKFGGDYVAGWEDDRPTIKPATKKSKPKIYEIFRKNIGGAIK
jgi:hypothetical protein